ncbi:MarR family winged helix-turn-helix transcriptional regulator [Paenibacillus senegalensis]|uniref:MarR family winged helix-turn-helix transcriptional regulator n=1 Tax=Paenibacillus senegalensis TaxID=1465766 RepID=UPI000289A651|nr:MarR family transcriptional regulator [Paenibacillus senegalensis]
MRETETTASSQQNSSDLEELQNAVGEFVYLVNRETRSIRGSLNLADGQIFLLMILSRHESVKASDIASRIGITYGAVTGMTDKLLSLGLITRERSVDDRRVVLISITEEGRKVMNDIRSERAERFRRLLGQMDDNTVTEAIALFAKLNRLFGKTEEHN